MGGSRFPFAAKLVVGILLGLVIGLAMDNLIAGFGIGIALALALPLSKQR